MIKIRFLIGPPGTHNKKKKHCHYTDKSLPFIVYLLAITVFIYIERLINN